MKKEFNRQRYELGQRIRKLRKRCDFCQESLVEKLGISQITLSRIENGTTRMNVEILMKLSNVLEVPINVILGIEDDGERYFTVPTQFFY